MPHRPRRRHDDRVTIDRRVAIDHEAETVVASGWEHDRYSWTCCGVAARPPAGFEPQRAVGNGGDQRNHVWPAVVAHRQQVAEPPTVDLARKILQRHGHAHPANRTQPLKAVRRTRCQSSLSPNQGSDARSDSTIAPSSASAMSTARAALRSTRASSSRPRQANARALASYA